MLIRDDGEEQREYMRMAVECGVSFKVADDPQLYKASTVNLSAGGLMMRSNKLLGEGEIIACEVLPDKAFVPPLRALARVVRVSAADVGEYEIGLQITEMLD